MSEPESDQEPGATGAAEGPEVDASGEEPPAVAPGSEISAIGKDERTWGMLAHLSAIAVLLTTRWDSPVPILNLLGPLFIWLAKKDSMPFAGREAKESLNFQITMTLLVLAAYFVPFLSGLLRLILLLTNVVFILIATLKANQGLAYRYPVNLRLFK